MSRNIFILGIAGGTGSGKSWLAHRLSEAFEDKASILQMDWYYHDRSNVKGDARLQLNFDHPRAIETALIAQDIKRLRLGLAIQAPQYDYATHRRTKRGIRVDARPLLIVEGLFVFHEPAIRSLLDYGVFLDVPADTRLMLRLRRDRAARRLDVEETLRLYEAYAKPMHERYVHPSARQATEIWSGLPKEPQIRKLIGRLRAKIRSK